MAVLRLLSLAGAINQSERNAQTARIPVWNIALAAGILSQAACQRSKVQSGALPHLRFTARKRHHERHNTNARDHKTQEGIV